MTSLFSRLQKLNKEATPPEWEAMVDDGEREAWIMGLGDGSLYVTPRPDETGGSHPEGLSDEDAALIVECRNSLPAVLNLIEAAKYAREQSQQLIGMDDPFGSQGPPILIGANAWFELADAVAVLVSGQEEPK